jgi:hypothetical protein
MTDNTHNTDTQSPQHTATYTQEQLFELFSAWQLQAK